MISPNSLRKWRRVPGRLALLLGLGALSAGGGEASPGTAPAAAPARVPQQSAKSFGEIRVWHDGNRLYVSEDGGDAQELLLADTAEAQRLRQLLMDRGAAAESPSVLQHRLILVGGGGDGFHWTPIPKPEGAEKAEGLGRTGKPAGGDSTKATRSVEPAASGMKSGSAEARRNR